MIYAYETGLVTPFGTGGGDEWLSSGGKSRGEDWPEGTNRARGSPS